MKKTLLVHGALLAILLMPTLAFAQLVPCNGPDCNWASLLQLAQNILNFMIQISIVIAALRFAYAGYLFFSSGGSSEKITEAKDKFVSVAIGIVVILVAWLVVNVLLETLTGEGLDQRAGEVSLESVDIQRPIV